MSQEGGKLQEERQQQLQPAQKQRQVQGQKGDGDQQGLRPHRLQRVIQFIAMTDVPTTARFDDLLNLETTLNIQFHSSF